jgi:hypothetical protein
MVVYIVAVATPFSLTSEKYPVKTMKFELIISFEKSDKKIYFKPLSIFELLLPYGRKDKNLNS